MSEGFFLPSEIPIPGLPVDRLCAAMVRILPRTTLVLDIMATSEEAVARARNETLPDGSECWYRFFTPQDVARINDPLFHTGMVRHEFSGAVRDGLSFPATVPLDGGGSGFAISPDGLVVTNYHLVTAEILAHAREDGVIGHEVECRTLRAQIASRNEAGAFVWRDAKSIWLVSNPPTARAVQMDENGRRHLREDTALLRIDPCPSDYLVLSERAVAISEQVWMAGFPLRSARAKGALRSAGYTDADGTLRVSSGQVVACDGDDYFVSDADGSMGNSGSPVLDRTGRVVGMFSRADGDGPRHALEYGHLNRVQVGAGLIRRGLGIHVGDLAQES